MTKIRILEGDCRLVMATLPEHSVDAIVCDPPYDLTTNSGGPSAKGQNTPQGRVQAGASRGGFMGMKWDATGVAFDVETWKQALRVLKPGGYLLAFGGTRTYHRMVVAIEDAGFEVRDQLAWVYGSGFPKSMDMAKAIDKALGVKGTFGAPKSEAHAGWIERGRMRGDEGQDGWQRPWMTDESAIDHAARQYLPASDEGKQWQGWGTALKPSWEPICMARKPHRGTIAANVMAHGTGALNIDGCRVEGESTARHTLKVMSSKGAAGGAFGNQLHEFAVRDERLSTGSDLGRWPANLIHDGSDEVLAAFPEAGGQAAPVKGSEPSAKTSNTCGEFAGRAPFDRRDGGGSAARFFKSCQQESTECLTLSPADAAASSSSLQSALAASVASAAAIWPSLAGVLDESCPAPSTPVTASECEALCAVAITAITTIASGYSPESRREKRSPCGSLVSVVATREQTGITTITANLSRSDGSAAIATCCITPTNVDRGDQGSANGRLHYTAKASAHDRHDGLDHPGHQFKQGRMPHDAADVIREGRGNHHPTVKPTDLMRYLCRLVTPPGGTVLDIFAGSGSTLKAAELEGFDAIGIELEPVYIEIARRRIASDAPLFKDVE